MSQCFFDIRFCFTFLFKYDIIYNMEEHTQESLDDMQDFYWVCQYCGKTVIGEYECDCQSRGILDMEL